MSPRKRKRSEALSESDNDGQIEQTLATASNEGYSTERQQEVWGAFREEYFEAIEQLPLSLHRQLSLMQQLDKQASGYREALLPCVQKYTLLRRRQPNLFGGIGERQTEIIESQQALDSMPMSFPSSNDTIGLRKISLIRSKRLWTSPIDNAPDLTGSPETSREILSHVVWLSEELLRASQEKVNLAQATHDSVDRHIRLLDQAIKEQEVSLGSHSNHSLPILLPELSVPRWNRTARVTASPMSDEEEATYYEMEDEQIEDLEENQISEIDGGRRPTRAQVKQLKLEAQQEFHISADLSSNTLRITLPAISQTERLGGAVATEVNEDLYCHCNRVSFGEMIACDGPKCDIEWFHLGCVGLLEIPKGKWFCDECKANKKTRSAR